jgi:hypothetical protein
MLDTKDFNFLESQASFDFKGFLLRLVGFWKWFVLSLVITFLIAYNINIRKEKIYGMQSSIVVKEENNPFFTSNTSLVFNWGGVSDKVQTMITTLKSRSHNEVVVDKLEYYIQYLQKGKYYYEDVYGIAPFYIQIDKNKGQLAGTPIKIKFISESKFELSVDFAQNPSKTLIHYVDNSRSQAPIDNVAFTKIFKIDEELNLPFLNGTIHLKPDAYGYAGKEYYIRFDDFNGTVGRYRGIDVSADMKAQSIVTLQIQGNNIHRLVEYLNETVNVLRKTQLDRKNQFATNTIRFIDSTLAQMEGQIKDAESELKDFRRGKNVFEIEGGGEMLTQKLSGYDVQKDELERKLKYLNNLRSYLVKNSDFSRLPAPTVAGIDEPNIIANVSNLIQLSSKRDELSYSVKEY